MKIDVKIHALHPEGSRLADASVCLDDSFAIRGVKIVNGSSGPFVSMPSYKSGNQYLVGTSSTSFVSGLYPKTHSFRCASSSRQTRCAGLRREGRRIAAA